MREQNSIWNVTPKEAVDIQRRLREEVRLSPYGKTPNIIAGCDVSMNRFDPTGYAGFVVLSYPNLEILDTSFAKEKIPFPYIPGLLSFREIPMLLPAWEKLPVKPDMLVVDGVGIAHPRRLGIASHLGLVLGIPTIGCAKSVLTGSYEEPDEEPGSFSDLVDLKTNEVIGSALRTKRGTQPVFISAGHLITLSEARDLVMTCVRKHRIPEPTRLAHNAVNEYRLKHLH